MERTRVSFLEEKLKTMTVQRGRPRKMKKFERIMRREKKAYERWKALQVLGMDRHAAFEWWMIWNNASNDYQRNSKMDT